MLLTFTKGKIMFIAPIKFHCVDYVRQHQNNAWKMARLDIERCLKEGNSIQVVNHESQPSFTAKQFYKINLLHRDHLKELLSNEDLIFTGEIENQPHYMGYYAVSKNSIRKILNGLKSLFDKEASHLSKKAESEKQAIVDAEKSELAELQKQAQRFEYLSEKYAASNEV